MTYCRSEAVWDGERRRGAEKKMRQMEGENNFGGIIKHQWMSHCLLTGYLKGHIDYVFCCNGRLYLPRKHPSQTSLPITLSLTFSHWLRCFRVSLCYGTYSCYLLQTFPTSPSPFVITLFMCLPLSPPVFLLQSLSPQLLLSQHPCHQAVSTNQNTALLIIVHQIIIQTFHSDEVRGVIQCVVLSNPPPVLLASPAWTVDHSSCQESQYCHWDEKASHWSVQKWH